ncbi:MAG: carboxyl-terminal processing protease [Planctomycetota bacterium]|jgi:carboxyl-terminal processing protease
MIQRVTADRDLELLRVVRDLAAETYVEELDEGELVDNALSGMIGGLDHYSRFYRQSEIEALDRTTRGEFRGIGVIFRGPMEDGQVLFAYPDGPAGRAGVEVGDTFLSINGSSVAELGDGGLRDTLQRRDSSSLEVELANLKGEQRTVTIQPEPVLDPSIRLAHMADEENGLGHISLLSFSSHSLEEFDAAMESLMEQGLRGLVLDLRGDGGGSVDAAVGIANRFVAEGRLVATRTRTGTQVMSAKPQEARHLGLPLVLLVDRDSASASEILAGALQDHGVTVLVGEATYGKGTVQTLTRFTGNRAIVKVTTAHYLTPAWRRIERDENNPEHSGIAPDVLLPLDDLGRAQVHAYLRRYHPPQQFLPAIQEWQAESGLALLPEAPEDPQLVAALSLLRGEDPSVAPEVALRDTSEDE